MASRIFMELIIEAARPIGAAIRRGKPMATWSGALIGGALGSSCGLVSIAFMPAMIVLAAVTGATLAALLFKRPPSMLGSRATDIEPFRPGAVVRAWAFKSNEFKSMTVLLEQAIYVVRKDSAPWDDVLQKLAQGEDPNLPLGDLIRLDELIRVEMRKLDATEITMVYSVAGRTKRRAMDFQTTDERDELIEALEQHFRTSFTRAERPMHFARAISTPLVPVVVLAVLFGAIAWLSAYWIAHPPRLAIGQTEPNEFEQFLIRAGPGGVILAGAVVMIAPLSWLAIRILCPPRIQVLQVPEGKPRS